ncbi:hypothetical protein G7046_g8133 [Stylonectria norvegica]|nr:hypothetical protein G7046_g8133 [Stylonectria norvegica]
MRSSILGASVALAGFAQARAPAPILLPSSNWQVASESYALMKEPHCNAARGGVYTPTASKKWSPMGIWQLGLEYLGYGGNGEYGLDTLTLQALETGVTLSMSGVLIAAINTTNYLTGFFGLGITQGNFGDKVADSPLTQAVQSFGWIPSYSYAYNAGAHYRNAPASLTLGGYDGSRFNHQRTDFTLGQTDGLASPLVRGSQMLSSWNSTFNAILDSSTPYLWLPNEVCDQFAHAMNLTYNSTFDLYTVTGDQYREYMKQTSFSYKFILSSFDNTDNFGEPYSIPGVVNITIPSMAFLSLLQYPFMDEAIKYGDPAVPYFSLRRSNNSSTFILGRSFLQETYLVTRYDEGLFSLHQALFPDVSASDANLTPIVQRANSPYPGPPSRGAGLTKGQLAGVIIAAVGGSLIVLAAAWYYRRRFQRSKASNTTIIMGENEDSTSNATRNATTSPIMRFLSKVLRRKGSLKSGSGAEKGEGPTEVPNSEIHELPAPVPPAELYVEEDASLTGDTELGTGSSQNMSAYELARRKLDRQLQGPVPPYTPPLDGVMPPPEKTDSDVRPLGNAQHIVPLSPASSRMPGDGNSNTNSLPISLPSPTSPRTDWSGQLSNVPSTMTATNPDYSTRNTGTSSAPTSPLSPSAAGQAYTTTTNTSSSAGEDPPSSLSNVSLPTVPSPSMQRTPIDPSKVVFLGALPGNVRLPRHNSLPRIIGQGHGPIPPTDPDSDEPNSFDSLGSNFTVEEDDLGDESTQLDLAPSQARPQQGQRPPTHHLPSRLPHNIQTQGAGLLRGHSSSTTEPDTPQSQERIDPGSELVHVPQLAERRYSWEEER